MWFDLKKQFLKIILKNTAFSSFLRKSHGVVPMVVIDYNKIEFFIFQNILFII